MSDIFIHLSTDKNVSLNNKNVQNHTKTIFMYTFGKGFNFYDALYVSEGSQYICIYILYMINNFLIYCLIFL